MDVGVAIFEVVLASELVWRIARERRGGSGRLEEVSSDLAVRLIGGVACGRS